MALLTRRTLSTIARRSTGQELPPSEIKKLRSLSIILGKFQRNAKIVYDADPGTPLTAYWWRLKRRKLAYRLLDTQSSLQLRRLDPTYNEEEFVNTITFSLFRQLNTALILGSAELAATCTTPTLFGLLKLEQDRVLYNALDETDPWYAARIVELLQVPQLVQTRVFRISSRTDYRFAQLTVRFLTKQSPVYENDKLICNKGLKRKRARILRRVPTINKAPDEWRRAFTNDGKEYYWHTGTREVTWKKPLNFDISLVHYNPALGTLSEGRIVEDNKDEALVESFVVYEKPLFNSSVKWKISNF